jgi:hypothetical protein
MLKIFAAFSFPTDLSSKVLWVKIRDLCWLLEET